MVRVPPRVSGLRFMEPLSYGRRSRGGTPHNGRAGRSITDTPRTGRVGGRPVARERVAHVKNALTDRAFPVDSMSSCYCFARDLRLRSSTGPGKHVARPGVKGTLLAKRFRKTVRLYRKIISEFTNKRKYSGLFDNRVINERVDLE